MKEYVCTAFGVAGGIASALIGGWSDSMIVLITVMAIDYITGLIVAGVFHASPKSPSGALESKAGWKGLCRKAVTLLIVIMAHGIDVVLGTAYIKDAVIIGFIANEVISILENAGLMGIPMPTVLTKAIDLLTTKAEAKNDK